MPDRIATILRMLEKTPDDVFLHYSLAMEYVGAGRCDEAAGEFRKCAELDEKYLPAYVELGKAMRTAGKFDEARAAFDQAMKIAQEKRDRHVEDYVRQQLEILPKG
ncbi:MAG: tetratricopeptide repeat protein [Planctomycetes bacterium]|nr:tetratricopeptide repeat protein [Planctomycetota bacterium]